MKKRAGKVAAVLCAVFFSLTLVFYCLGAWCVYSELGSDNDKVTFSEVLYNVCCENTVPKLWTKIKYKCFGSFRSENAEQGKNGFLFPKKSADGKFDYVADRRGENAYSDAELEELKKIILQRKNVYAQMGTEYCLLIIPNSQTVYGEYVNDKKACGKSRAEQLTEYLSKSDISVYMAQLDTNGEYPLYNNTENTANTLGGYYLYRSLMSYLPESVEKRTRKITLDEAEIKTAYTKGKSLTDGTGLERLIRNYDVYFSLSQFNEAYEIETPSGTDGYTKLKSEYRTTAAGACVIFQIPTQYERQLLQPFLSSSFTSAVYTVGQNYSENLIKEYKPSCVVTVLREDELYRLTDGDDIRSFDEVGLRDEKTETPEITAKTNRNRKTALLFGKAESGALIAATYDGYGTTCVCRDGLFILEVEMYSLSEQVKITASVSGKLVSDPIYVTVKYSVASPSAESVVYGGDMLYYASAMTEYKGENLFSDKELGTIKASTEKFISSVRSMTGKNTKLALLVAPDPVTVYGSDSTDKIKNDCGENTRTKQLSTLFSSSDSVIMPYLAQEMIENKDLGKLYYQTDTHWSELGAFLGYYTLLSRIENDFPSAKPHSLDDFTVKITESCGGDLAGYLGVGDTVYESVPYLEKKFTSRINEQLYDTDTIGRAECTRQFTTTVSDNSLPTAYIMRDSYSSQLYPLLSEHFSTAFYEEMWKYTPDEQVLQTLCPDYIIIIITERNLAALSTR